MHSWTRSLRAAAPLMVALAATLHAQLPAGMTSGIDSAAREALARTGAPSASIAIVKDDRIVYEHAYGVANVATNLQAATSMRYSIGSVSKQFTATAILLLAERHKLSLDDKVGRWLPGLTRSNEVSIRQILSMTSGYQDYWPQDYVMPPMLVPTTARKITDEWAKKPLDFEPGTRWQYSNTNYVIAGMIVEKASGVPLVQFLQKEIFTPLQMTTVSIIDDAPLGDGDPARYLRYALGPLRPAPKEGKGWLFAAGELAMTPADLARWDISVINQRVLKSSSYAVQQTNTLLKNGTASGYGLGVSVASFNGHRMVEHNGEVSGFTTENMIFPDDRMAVVVCVNLDATSASGQIANRIAGLLFATSADSTTDKAVVQARRILEGLQKGTIDRTLFTENANAYFSAQALADFQSSLAPLGAITELTQRGTSLRGGMTFRGFTAAFGQKRISISTFTLPNGKLEQFQIAAP